MEQPSPGTAPVTTAEGEMGICGLCIAQKYPHFTSVRVSLTEASHQAALQGENRPSMCSEGGQETLV